MTSSNRRRFARPFALALIAAGATVVVAPPAAATPNAGDTVNFSSACGDQYPAADGFSIGQAYLVSPQDAYSWRSTSLEHKLRWKEKVQAMDTDDSDYEDACNELGQWKTNLNVAKQRVKELEQKQKQKTVPPMVDVT